MFSQGMSANDSTPEVIAELPNAGDRIVLYPYDSVSGRFRNLVRVRLDGSLVWEASLPTNDSQDAYVSAEVHSGRLVANSWSCYRVFIDWSTGHVLDAEFTK